jgi:hypothetical protein
MRTILFTARRELDCAQALFTISRRTGRARLISATWAGLVLPAGGLVPARRLIAVARGLIARIGLVSNPRRARAAGASAALIAAEDVCAVRIHARSIGWTGLNRTAPAH